ncbi:MAG TPA: nuclear transport factor 2 family protein [Kofleriaceae bacterium]|nr:nuclear transport factor 2 family protein [Kofleriaceae bacterium]
MTTLRGALVVVIVALAACPRSAKQGPAPLADPVSSNEHDLRASLVAELQDDILKSYERDEPPEWQNGMLLPEIGPARIGVGPGDVLIGAELERAPSRWPLDVDKSTPTEPRSKRLEINLSKDSTAAWVTDEISWRIKMCQRTAVIPLRFSALYARDGDRWVPVYEHLSFARTPTPTRPGQKLPRSFPAAVASRDLADDLSRVLSPVLRRAIDKSPGVVAQGPDATLIGPDIGAEWRGPDMVQARLVPGTDPIKLEDRRVGIVGRSIDSATVAYWLGNVTADLPARPGYGAGKAHFRATFVFERRGDNWVIVQGHVSHALEDQDLASAVFGTALISPKPLQITCDDGSPGEGR